MQIAIIWGEPETSYIRRFIDRINKVGTVFCLKNNGA